MTYVEIFYDACAAANLGGGAVTRFTLDGYLSGDATYDLAPQPDQPTTHPWLQLGGSITWSHFGDQPTTCYASLSGTDASIGGTLCGFDVMWPRR